MYSSRHSLKRVSANFWHDDFWDGLGGNALIIISLWYLKAIINQSLPFLTTRAIRDIFEL